MEWKLEDLEKNSRSKDKNQPQTQPSRTQAKLWEASALTRYSAITAHLTMYFPVSFYLYFFNMFILLIISDLDKMFKINKIFS